MGELVRRFRVGAMGVAGVMALLCVFVTGAGTLSAQEVEPGPPPGGVQVDEPRPDAPPTTSPTEETLGAQATTLPDDWAAGRAVDGPDRLAADAVIVALTETFGNRAGVVKVTGDAFLFPVVGLTEEDAALVREQAAGLGTPIEPVDAMISKDRLQEISEGLADRWPEAVVAGVDLETDTVFVSLLDEEAVSEDEVRDAAAEIVEGVVEVGRAGGSVSDSVEASGLVRVGSGRIELTADERHYSPLRSGRWLNVDLRCTAGFLMRTATGALRHTTAGHCASGTGDNVLMTGGAYVGEVTFHEPGNYDWLSFNVPSSHDALPAVTINSSGTYRSVEGWITGNYANNQFCWAGWGIWDEDQANERCGTQNRQITYRGHTLLCLERRTFGGDSGGPVYWLNENGQAYAAGTVVLSWWEDGSPFDRWFMCFNRMTDIMNATGYSLVTWPHGK